MPKYVYTRTHTHTRVYPFISDTVSPFLRGSPPSQQSATPSAGRGLYGHTAAGGAVLHAFCFCPQLTVTKSDGKHGQNILLVGKKILTTPHMELHRL